MQNVLPVRCASPRPIQPTPDAPIPMYRDIGCRIAPSCLSCPLPRCVLDGFRPRHPSHPSVDLSPLPRRRRTRVMVLTVRILVARDAWREGMLSQLAAIFGVSRQRVHQVVRVERR